MDTPKVDIKYDIREQVFRICISQGIRQIVRSVSASVVADETTWDVIAQDLKRAWHRPYGPPSSTNPKPTSTR